MIKILVAILLFIYIEIVEKYYYEYWGLASGIAFLVGGIIGLLTKGMVFNIGIYGGKRAVIINWILIILGIIAIIYGLIVEI